MVRPPVAALRRAAPRLLTAAALVALALGCAEREAARRTDAAPALLAVPARPPSPDALAPLRAALAAAAGTDSVEFASAAHGDFTLLRVVVPARALFRADTAALHDGGATLLRDWGVELARDRRLEIEVEGHSDEIGRAAYNLEFSRQRAEAVRAALIAAGVAPHRIVAAGAGEARPLAGERGIAARERNRRVEITVRLR